MNKRKLLTGLVLITLIIGCYWTISNSKGEVICVEANEAQNFYTDYYLYIPKHIDKTKVTYILVEPNNTGITSDDHMVHERDVQQKIENGRSRQIADELGVPLLIPVFDRLESDWTFYTHALDRDALQKNDGYLARIDLQLIGMIDHVSNILENRGLNISKKVMLTGFSASGSFVNRFTALHPDMVQCVVAGGVNCMPILPLEELQGEKLIYPIGIYDLEELTGASFDYESYYQIPQFIYMGSRDDNDTLPYDDAFGELERELILSVLGENMHDRWNLSKQIYEDSHINAELVMYKDIGHTINETVQKDTIAFFKDSIR